MKYLIIIFISILFLSCAKDEVCEECFLIKEDDLGNVLSATRNGKFCDEDIKKHEDLQFVYVCGNCYNRCW